jgi:dephospho-CoA kinase
VVDTDAIAHELTQPQGSAIAAIRRNFSEKYITTEGALNREEMRSLIFSDNCARRELEAILHPLIRTEVARRAAAFSAPYGMIVVPLLLETSGYRETIQRVLVVDCNEQSQVARTLARTGLDEQNVHAIMATQLSRKERLLQADDVIGNHADLLHVRRQVEALHCKYLALANKR